MELERPSQRVFIIEAAGNELYDKVSLNGKIKIPDSIVELKKALPKIATGDLDIRESTIPEAGKGVFAERDFAKNELITYYEGPILSKKEADLLPIKTHHKSIVALKYVQVGLLRRDGKEIQNPKEELSNGGIAAFLNDSRSDENNNTSFLILDMKENQKIWVKMIEKARRSDPNNKATVRLLMPIFDTMIREGGAFQLIRRIIVVKALRNIKRGEELFASYGNNYPYFAPPEGAKRLANDDDLREGNEKRKKCSVCFSETYYRDLVHRDYLCSPLCQSSYYDKYPEKLLFSLALCDDDSQ